ncbi:uncharacterized mitochondrial protein AtMg00810-like [Impatiens glandulifera]|uniref:uncharacterized mitochondrial protein AtMg00810-like n=1 Tax=Impatiens glandulifera TaxID=253017 RepID=UPI001FB168AF|nr:uncharacterized mitochondrial protein AtMg00810-like [Impatiens glandulifera]
MSMMGELTLFLGLQVRQLEESIFINQTKYTKDLLKKFGMENCSATATPMSSSNKLDKDEDGQSVNITAYRGIIGSLLYLTASWLDIMFVVSVYGRFQANPKQSHYDYTGCKLDRKSTSGTFQFLGDRLISWLIKKQTSVATSIAEVEYLAVGSCCSQLLWVQQLLRDYAIEVEESPIFYNSTSAVAIC